jgi:N-acetylated-alpha-linked acidic dipeptidase
VDLGVNLKGKIALAKYGGPFRGLKVKNAQDFGMIGCVIFTDPAEDGDVTEAKGYAAYPSEYIQALIRLIQTSPLTLTMH